MVELTRKEYIIIAKNRSIIEPQNMTTQELINTLTRYDSRCKVKKIHRELLKLGLEKIAKIQNISKSELNQPKKLERKSIDELKEIARLRRIKNTEKLTKEDLIISLSKSESSIAERHFKKLFNNNNTYDDTYDDKIIGKISYIRVMILSRLGNINDRKKIKKELHEIEKRENLSDNEKKEIYDFLVKVVRTSLKKKNINIMIVMI